MLFVAALVVGPALTAEPAAAPKPFRVPYQLLTTKHVVVRARVNGKGPFRFILDTGAPAVFLSKSAAEKAGVEAHDEKFSTLDRLDVEGGVRLDKVQAKVENLAQLDAMNEIGLAGVELHGVLGYNVLARFRVEYDFTADRLAWTPLAHDPGKPQGASGLARTGVESLAGVIKLLGSKLGPKPTPAPLRGGVGVELAPGPGPATVKAVLPNGPAAAAGLRPGDVITSWDDARVKDAADLLKLAASALPGKAVAVAARRGDEAVSLTVTPGRGF